MFTNYLQGKPLSDIISYIDNLDWLCYKFWLLNKIEQMEIMYR